ncbi:hypothetical protein ACS0TY_013755 [Phlomoides rotata]
MATDLKGKGVDLGEEEIVRLNDEELYDLPAAVRTLKLTNLIWGKIGEVLEVDLGTMEGITCSVRLKMKVDL